jgi:hypothetical protein
MLMALKAVVEPTAVDKRSQKKTREQILFYYNINDCYDL